MKKFMRVFCAVMALLMMASVLAGCSSKSYTANNTEIVIGVSGPLTGGASIYGIAVKNSAQMAIDEINAAGGLDGMKFKLVSYDDEHKPEKVADGYASLLQGGMQISLGTVTTKPGLEFSKLSKEDNVFFLTPSATGDKIPEFSNGYQMCFADSNQGTAAAKQVNTYYADKKIGVIFNSSDAYSTGILAKFKESLNADLKASLVEASFASDDVTDFSSQVNILKDCEFIFMPIYYGPASLFMLEANKVKNSIEIYYGCDGLDGIDAIEGFDITTVPQEVSMLTHFNSSATEGPAKVYLDKYNAKFTEPTNQFGASAYDCVYAIFNALKNAKAAGKEITTTMSASEFCELLKEQFKTLDFVGITGEFKDGVQSHISWETNGFVNKTATIAIIKAANAK